MCKKWSAVRQCVKADSYLCVTVMPYSALGHIGVYWRQRRGLSLVFLNVCQVQLLLRAAAKQRWGKEVCRSIDIWKKRKEHFVCKAQWVNNCRKFTLNRLKLQTLVSSTCAALRQTCPLMSLYAFNIWENICYFISINKLNLWKTPVHYSVAIVYRLKKTEESKPSQVWNVTDATTQNYKLGLQILF